MNSAVNRFGKHGCDGEDTFVVIGKGVALSLALENRGVSECYTFSQSDVMEPLRKTAQSRSITSLCRYTYFLLFLGSLALVLDTSS